MFSSDAELIAASDAELPADDLPAATQDSSPFSHNDKAGIKHNVDQQSAHSAQPASNFQYLNLQSTSFIRAAADSAVSSEANKTSETREASPDSANFEESTPSGVIPSASRKPSLHVLNNSHRLQTVAKKTFIEKPKPEPQIEQHQTNTESSKAKLFASKAKHNLSDMLGAELPDREISLDFKFSLQKGKKELGDLPSKKDIEKYLAQKGASFNQILKHSDRDILLIAKYKLSPNDRLRLLSLFLPFFFAKAQQLAISFERKAFDAKNTSRLEQLSLSQSSIKGLISGYKQIYAELYALNNFQYKRQQAQANQVAFHLCLLLCLEQRLLFASKAKVSAHSIKTFNKLATVLRHYEPDEFNAVRKCVTEKTPRSIAQLWTKYQLLLCFDSSDIATGLQPQLIAYLDQQLLNQIQLVLPEDIDYLDASQYLILNENHDCRPSLLDLSDTSNEQVQLKLNAFNQRDSQSGDYCFIAVDNLFNQIKHDFSKQLAILENQHNFDNQPIDALQKLQISANFFASMNKYVAGIEQDLKKSSYSLVLNQQIEVRLGITAIQDYIESLMKRIDEESSQRSTAEQNKPAKFGFRDWSIASEQQGLLYLQTQL
ncbi:MAG: hypothetical protein HRU21_12820, partial [Pseudomonadales bacterium]|nr:hypothetical protein [Pseudomonadales bacterium]